MEPMEPVRHHDLHADATGGLELVQDFVNTNDLERGRDALGTPAQLRDWLVERALLPAHGQVDVEDHRRALAVREGLRALGRANNEEALNAGLVEAMNQAGAAAPVTVMLEPGGWQLAPAAAGVDGFLGRLMAIVARSMADDTWSRVKACRNDTCRWLFYDRSRNRSGTWCTMAVCGSRIKARAYRARQRQSAGT